MKHIILGILITSASISFAQIDDTETHQLKKRFVLKKAMVVQPVSANIIDNSQTDISSRKETNAGLDFGIVSIEDGVAYIYVKSEPSNEKLLPSNLPEGMRIDGQEIQFNYTCTAPDARLRKSSSETMKVEVFDVSVPKRR